MNKDEEEMINPDVEELLEGLYVCEVEQGSYPPADIVQKGGEQAVSLRLAELREDKYKLTEEGRQAGQNVVRRHRLAERLLKDVLAVGPADIEEDACRFEHVLQDGVDDKVCILLGHPTCCPHGKSIPPGECCRAAQGDMIKEVRPLCDGKPESRGAVAYLATMDNRQVQKLVAMGILPGAEIKVIRNFPSYVFQVGYSQFAVDRPLAEVIYVRWDDQRR
ncbi:MAG: FeoA domain-containing protein [Phycisphaerales bacterium]|nr:MAG: FeoA domain-containing protein [Phycisphaerales bacterium]